MATDATGPATSPDSIPTYLTSADPPSGKGFNAAMAAIQTALSGRVTKPASIAANEIPVYNGATFVRGTLGNVSVLGLAGANTDFGWVGGLSPVTFYNINGPGAGSLRNVQGPGYAGQRLVIKNLAAAAVTLIHNTAGTGAVLYNRTLATVTLQPNEAIEYVYNGSLWDEINRDQATAASSIIYRKTTAKTVGNSAAETDLLNGEITIAGNAMGASGLIRGTLFLDLLNNASTNMRYRLKLGATTLLDTGAVFAPTNNATRTWLEVGFEIMNLGATNSQVARLKIIMPGGADTFATVTGVSGGGALSANYHYHAIGTATEDTTSSKTLVFTVQHGAASVNQEVKLYGAVIEVF